MFRGVRHGGPAVSILMLSVCALWAQAPGERIAWKEGTSFERRLAGSGTDTFQIPLLAGQFLRLQIVQKGADLATSLRDPGGQPLMEVDSDNERHGPETVVVIAETSGDYSLRVTDGDARDGPTPYEVNVLELRQAKTADRNLVVAHRNYAEGIQLRERHVPEARQQAIEKLALARDFFRASGDQYMLSLSLFSLGAALGEAGEFRRALPLYEEAAAQFHAIGDARMEANAVNNYAGALDVLGEPAKAIQAYRQALAFRAKDGDRREEANLLNNIGLAEATLTNWQAALRDYRQALALCRQAADRRLEALILNNTGVAYRQLGDFDQALSLFEQALALEHHTGDKGREALTLENLAGVHRVSGQPAKALEDAEQALGRARALGDRRLEARVFQLEGFAYTDLRRYREADEALQRGLELAQGVGDRLETAYMMINLARSALLDGRAAAAAQWSAQALTEFRAIGDRSQEAITLEIAARAEEARGNLAEARARIEEALQLNEEARTRTDSEQLRSSFFATRQDAYGFYIDLLMRIGSTAAALEASERARARSFLEMMAETGTDIRAGVDPKLLEREREISNALNAKGARLLALGGRQNQQAAELTSDIRGLETDYQEVQAAIRQSSPRYAALTQPRVLTAREIETQLLDADTLLLEYSLGEERSYLWVVSNIGVRAFPLPSRARIDAQVRKFLQLITTRADAQLPGASRELSDMVLGDAAGTLGDKRLVIVPDGALQELPFAMLPLPRSAEPLLVRHEVTVAPSASALAVVRRELEGRKPAPKMLAVFADPVFGPDDPRAGRGTLSAHNGSGTRILEHTPDPDAAGESVRVKIPRLPFTAQEADQILSVARGGENLRATGFQASRAAALQGQLGEYRYLHFATHGYLDTERPSLSALVLSQLDSGGRPEDGFLRVDDIYNLHFSADLAVLSACETGLGKEVRGEGLMGLTRAFLYAGVPRVIVSLWNVNDRATAELMAALYRAMLREGKSPAAALRAAQLELRKQKQWQAPYYWAAFVEHGEWR